MKAQQLIDHLPEVLPKKLKRERDTMLKLIGPLEPGKPTVLFLAGSITDPCVYDQAESDGVF